jgi:hypothetical protein
VLVSGHPLFYFNFAKEKTMREYLKIALVAVVTIAVVARITSARKLVLNTVVAKADTL